MQLLMRVVCNSRAPVVGLHATSDAVYRFSREFVLVIFLQSVDKQMKLDDYYSVLFSF